MVSASSKKPSRDGVLSYLVDHAPILDRQPVILQDLITVGAEITLQHGLAGGIGPTHRDRAGTRQPVDKLVWIADDVDDQDTREPGLHFHGIEIAAVGGEAAAALCSPIVKDAPDTPAAALQELRVEQARMGLFHLHRHRHRAGRL